MSRPDLKDALQAVQKILRETGLPHLAAQIPIRMSGDLQGVRGKLETIDFLLRLRPPPEAVQKALGPTWNELLTRIKEQP